MQKKKKNTKQNRGGEGETLQRSSPMMAYVPSRAVLRASTGLYLKFHHTPQTKIIVNKK